MVVCYSNLRGRYIEFKAVLAVFTFTSSCAHRAERDLIALHESGSTKTIWPAKQRIRYLSAYPISLSPCKKAMQRRKWSSKAKKAIYNGGCEYLKKQTESSIDQLFDNLSSH